MSDTDTSIEPNGDAGAAARADQPGAVPAGLPEAGTAWPELHAQLVEMKRRDWDPYAGRLPLHAYFAGDEVKRVAEAAFMMFAHQNHLAPNTFPSLERMESELVAMVGGLLRAPSQTSGNLTSGGSESIMLALKAARDRDRARRGGAHGAPNIVIPASAHPAFDKGAHLLGLRVVRVALDRSLRCRVDAMAEAIDEQTILLAGSLPSLPFGSADPIEPIARLAAQRGIWCHVDACLGGLVAPFAAELGYAVPQFDFSVPGVSSISTDLHKFGYAMKGASLLLYADERDHRYQPMEFRDWPKGLYRTPTLLGSRSGGPVAAAWAVMRHLGRSGYRDVTRRLMALRDAYLARFAELDGLAVLGSPPLSVFAVASTRLDVFVLAQRMRERGWYMSLVADPLAFQQTLSLAHEPVMESYFQDLREALVARDEPARASGGPRPRWDVTTY
ncbi:pyridoxal phosphate-dependent decarboxylase family protein [Burkholderia gladioli]|uniref:pyridoxal phosphate-dependent decarboxylase family protein n=1 Tax=Burkholderia gladioli TaxID=28095 RepID=UPI001F155F34|nr:aminotransferase class V-fold PLP-dependent enzyme [Burkholderia gladioli]